MKTRNRGENPWGAAGAALVLALSLSMGACASRPTAPASESPPIERSLEQPLRDLSVIQEAPSPVLRRAVAGPYDHAAITDCPALTVELAQLDSVLGPDLAPGATAGEMSAQGLAADLIGGAISLPFRGVVRRVTGAQQREASLRAAVLAGMVRRGYLKGRGEVLGCWAGGAPP